MDATPRPLICQWCRQPVPPGTATWWDGQPQCPDPHACDQREQNQENHP